MDKTEAFTYTFRMADVGFRLCSTVPLRFSEDYTPFLDDHVPVQVVYHLREGDISPTGKKIYTGEHYEIYDSETAEERLFTDISPRFLLRYNKAQENEFSLLGKEETLQGLSGMLLRSFCAMELPFLRNHGFLLHASLVRYHGKGIVFSAPSGVGKSTQAELWRTHFGAEVLNGDRAVIRNTEAGTMAYGSVFCGSSGICRNEKTPLSGIVLLEQHNENMLSPISGKEAFLRLFSQCLQNPWNARFVNDLTTELSTLLGTVPVMLLRCRPDAEAAEIVREKLFGNAIL